MGVIERDFIGRISNAFVPLTNELLPYFDFEKQLDRFRQYEKDKIVYVVDGRFSSYWTEGLASVWFANNHIELGYTNLIQEHTPKFKELKQELDFYGRPDYLAKDNGEWKIIEIECWVHKYLKTHPEGYADVVVAYDSYREEPDNVKIITMKEHYGVQDIISSLEFSEFMWLYDKEFKHDYEKALLDRMKNKVTKSTHLG